MEIINSKQFSYHNFKLSYAVSRAYEENFETHCHMDVEYIMIYNGVVDIVIEEKKFHITQPCLIILLPAVYHSVSAKKKSNYERLTGLFPLSNVPKEICQEFLDRTKNNPVIETEGITAIQKKLKEIFLKENTEKYAPYIHSILTELFYMIIENNDGIITLEHNEIISKIIKYINENLDKMISVQEIADLLFLSESSVCHIFKQYTNTTIKQYIIHKKMLLAENMLNEGMAAVNVAKSIGYTNYSNFCSIYKKVMHKFPKAKKSL